MGDAVRVVVGAKTWLLNFGKFLKEVLIRSCCLDDLVGGSRICRGEGGGNRVNNPVIHETKDPLAFKVYTQPVRFEKNSA